MLTTRRTFLKGLLGTAAAAAAAPSILNVVGEFCLLPQPAIVIPERPPLVQARNIIAIDPDDVAGHGVYTLVYEIKENDKVVTSGAWDKLPPGQYAATIVGAKFDAAKDAGLARRGIKVVRS